MKPRVVWLALVCLILSAGSLAAQARVLSGTVTDSAVGSGLAGASVTIPGTRLGAYTKDNGTFLIAGVPEGEFTLLVRFIGYKRRTITIGADENTVAIALARDFLRLEEIVITGQATGVERRSLPNAVATVGADEIQRTPAPTLEAALQGKVPGAYIQANGGAPGGGIQVNLRGISTINAGSDPLFVVDGIVISNASIPNGQNAVTAAGAGGNASNQDNPTNRLADLNPADIERIEILKGGSAAAIYGSKATNGVVIITTKRGQAGRTQFNVAQRFGVSRISNKIGQRTFRDSADAASVYSPALVGQYFVPGRRVDYEELLYGQQSLASETELSINGGTEQTRFYLSGLIKNEPGIALGSGYKKQGFRMNLDQSLGRRFSVSLSTSLTHSTADRALSNNDNTGTSPGLVLPFTPSFFDPRPDSLGIYPVNPFERSNPLQTLNLLRNREDVWRALGTVTTKWAAVTGDRHTLNLTVIGGADYFNQRNDFLSPPELQFEPLDGQPGTVILGKAANLNTNLTLNGTHVFTPSSRWSATTSVGVQYEYRELNNTSIIGRSLLTGQSSPDQATTRDVSQDLRPVKDLGIYGQEEVLLLDRRLLLTAGLRADRSSNNGDPSRYFYYPKLASSYRVISPFAGLDEVKLRGAYGETGNQPNFGAKFTPDTSGIYDGNFTTSVGPRAGDPNIRPERQREIELGFDAQLAKGRAQLSFSWYQRNITDLLLDQTLAPSTGQTTRIFNSGGTLRNRGIELGLQVIPVQTSSVYWVFGTSFSRNRSLITKLPIPTFQTGGFGTSLGVFQIEQGKSATQIIGLVNGAQEAIGDAYPDFQMSFTNDVEWNNFRFGMHWEWKKGGDVINLTRLLFDAGSNSPDKADGGAARIGEWAAGNTKVYLEDGTYLKMREISVSYGLPGSLVTTLFGGQARSARISLSGRNLIRIADYTGYDPEVSNFGNQAIVRNIDVAPYPPSRSFYLSLDVGF